MKGTPKWVVLKEMPDLVRTALAGERDGRRRRERKRGKMERDVFISGDDYRIMGGVL